MASETITRNDLTNILNEVLPPTPSEYKKLLWTNSSPTAEFSPQTVTLDLSDYDEVEVYAGFINSGASTNMCGYFRAKVGGAGLIQLVNLDTTYNASAATFINIVSRQFQVSTTGVTFANGQMAYAGSAYVDWAGRAVPFAIYGIKYERVLPPQLEDLTIIESFGLYNNIPATGTWNLPNTKSYKRLFLFFPMWGSNNSTTLASTPVVVGANQSSVTFTNWTNRAGGVVTNTTISATVFAIRMEF